MDSHFDNLIDQFENELKSGASPQIENYLNQSSEESKQRVLLELISLEIYYLAKQEQPVTISDYARFGQTALTHAEQAMDNSSIYGGINSATLVSDGNDESTIKPSKMIGPYKLLQKLGEGGMGTVWMAEQEEPIKRRVAVKLIKSELASEEITARFEAERQALAMMDHQSIAKVLDAGTTDAGTPYFVMELVKGIPIAQYCDSNRLSVEERLKLFVPVCKAVQHAHQKGILHRDLKPSNVLVTLSDSKPIPKVIDFGMAKATAHNVKLSERTMFTEFGKVVGTIQYMSPEQAELNALDVDTRTDIYSLGVMLYELLTGSTPVDKATLGSNAFLQVLEIIRDKDPPRPSTRLSSSSGEATSRVSADRQIGFGKLQQILKGDLDWVVMKALEKDRTRRYQTANDFAEDISNFLTGETVKARPPSTWYQIQKFAARNRGLVASILAVGLVLLVGIAGTSYGLIRSNQKTSEAERERENAKSSEHLALNEKNKAEKNEQRAAKAERLASAESKRARDSEASAKFQLANARWESNRALEARNLLHQIPPEYRDNFEWNFCSRHFQGSDITCYGHTDRVYKVAFSPDGKCVASAGGDNTIRLWDVKSGKEIATLKGHTHQVGSIAFSANGNQLASACFDSTIKLWDTQSYQEITTFKGHSGLVATVVFSPSGKQLASASDDKTIKLWDAQTYQEIMTLTGHTGEVGSVAFSPDGESLASASVDQKIKLWDTRTGKEITTISGHSASVISVAFSPDGTHLASASKDAIKLWDALTRREITTLKGHSQFVHSVAFSPDGMRLASASRDKTIKLWDMSSFQEITTFTGHGSWVNGVAFSPDGERLASASFDKTIKLWDVRSGQRITTIGGHFGTVHDIATSPDGTRIASAGVDNTIHLWDMQPRQQITKLKGHQDTVSSVAFSPDSSRLASASSDNTIKLWDMLSNQEIITFEGHEKSVNDVTFSPDGKRLASASDDHSIILWDLKTGEILATLKEHKDAIDSVAFNPDGTRIASSSADGTIKLWDAQSYQVVETHQGFARRVDSVVFSPDGTQFAAIANQSIFIWDARTGQELTTLKGHTELVSSIAFTPDSTRLASASHDKTIKLWDLNLGQEISTLQHTDRASSLAFNADGLSLASAGTNSTIRLWDARPDQEIKTLKGHTDTVMGVAFGIDGTRIYSVSDQEKLVWDVATGKLIPNANWDPPADRFHVSPDGRWFVTSELNDVVLVDLEFKNTPIEKSYRIAKARYVPQWHRVQASDAKSSGNWFAATLHFAGLILNDPEQAEYYDGLHSSHQNLVAQFEENDRDHEPYLTTIVTEALTLPRGNKLPELNVNQAQGINAVTWGKAKTPVAFKRSPLTDFELKGYRSLVNQYPLGIYYNTLATAEFRMRNYEEAINAALKSIELSPREDKQFGSPYPGDFAIIAMSHFKLGDMEKANEFRDRLKEAMNLVAFREDEECKSFNAEVDNLFTPPIGK